MELCVERFASDKDTTLSLVRLDNEFQCFGLEDEYREDKLAGETRIPADRYRIGVRTEGGFHIRYGRKFMGMHRGILQIMDVPEFTYVLIHVGNTDDDTAGCLLVGQGAQSRPEDMSVQASVAAYKDLYRKVIDSALADDLTIQFVDLD